ncbi:hypothetical protein BOX15_Mlig015904g1 [Macrostomum lignano]|uniref:Hsp90 chaperone protein kinase-targeting subunit n=1 Tax=Macrostomum lignano TaxID=282301 RepID=A0A267GG78_9PLAT|nr:hypothetical protein BOX15_Mlig015904g1 [Macrostomum lignano]
MSKGINYSKWDHIEVSDDEDDTHPNIDTPSLFRWRHEARVKRMEELAKEKSDFEAEWKQVASQIDEAQRQADAGDSAAASRLAQLKDRLSKLEAHRQELAKKEKSQPLNIDTICKEGKTRTIINKAAAQPPKPRTDEETWKNLEEFKQKYDKEIKKFGMFSKFDDAQRFLEEHTHLVCEAACDRLVLWCVDLAVEEKASLLEYVTKQCICLQFLLKLGAELGTDPRNCLRQFYARLRDPQPEYMRAFEEELAAFRQRVQDRAKARLEDAMREYEEEQRQARLGPGGLDPVEVFDSLPDSLKACFESKDIALLQKTLAEMPIDEARYHMKRCVDSGMWVPDASSKKLLEGDEAGAEAAGESEEEAEGEAASEGRDKSEGDYADPTA